MRLFIAADLHSAARAAVGDAVTQLRDRAEQVRQGSTRGVSWADPRNLHLTLHFLGDIDEARLPPLTEALAPPLALAPPRIGLAGWGVFPPRGPARVIWIGVSAGAAALASAHRVLGERLRSVGMTPEARPFSPHLTVGRVKVPSGPLWGRLTASMPSEPLCDWQLEACTVFQSLLSPAGPTYRALLTIPFTAHRRREPPDIREARHAE
jgi:2'-5' RNA ligase